MDAKARRSAIYMRMALGDIVHTASLAKEYGVSERTIQLDMKELMLSYDIVSDKKGYYRLKEIPKPIDEEMKEIVKSLLYFLGVDSFVEFKDVIENILGVHNEKYLIFDSKKENIKNFSNFKLILQMLRWNYSLEIEYNDKKKVIHPFKIANLNGYWYLIALELNSNKLKSYLLNKITSLNSMFENMLANETLEKEIREKLKTHISPWINEDLKEVKLKIYPPFNEAIKRNVPINCEVLEKNKDYILIKLHYYSQEEALNFIKRHISSIEVLDDKLKNELKKQLQDYLMRN